MSEITEEQIIEFYAFLQGTLPEGMEIIPSHRPKLSQKKAFSIIWYLQEHLHILPSKFEMCDGCHEIYDSYREGYSLSEEYRLDGKVLPKKYRGRWCDACVPDVDFESP